MADEGMKTYNEYLKIIKDREWKEGEPERQRIMKLHEEHGDIPLCTCFITSGDVGKMTFDYSVEIMGMMMQDFLEELPKNIPFQFTKDGRLKVDPESEDYD